MITYFFRAGGILLYSSAIAQALGLLTSVALARLAGTEDFGALNLIRGTLVVAGVLAGSGFGILAVNLVAKFRGIDSARVGQHVASLTGIGWKTGLVVSMAISLGAYPIMGLGLSAEDLIIPLILGSFGIVFTTLGGILSGVLAGLEQYYDLAKVMIFEALVVLVLSVAGLSFFGLIGAISGTSLASCITWLFKRWKVKASLRRLKIFEEPHSTRERDCDLLRLAYPAVMVGVAAQGTDWLARYLLASQPGGFRELGLFTVAATISQLVLFFPAQASTPSQALMSRLMGSGNFSDTRKAFLISFTLSILTSMMAAAPFFMFPSIVTYIYGDQYRDAISCVVVLAAAAIFASTSNATKNYLYAVNKIGVVAASHAIMGVVVISFYFLSLEKTGLSMAFAYLLGWIVLIGYQLFFVLRHFKSS